MPKPSNYHKKGLNCAESMIKSFNEEHNENIPVSLGSGMGSGMRVGSICGAVNAAAMIIGYLKGRENHDEKNTAAIYTKELMKIIREKYNSELCLDLKKSKVSCSEIEDFTYDALNILLQQEENKVKGI